MAKEDRKLLPIGNEEDMETYASDPFGNLCAHFLYAEGFFLYGKDPKDFAGFTNRLREAFLRDNIDSAVAVEVLGRQANIPEDYRAPYAKIVLKEVEQKHGLIYDSATKKVGLAQK
jgi:hypothetical protein